MARPVVFKDSDVLRRARERWQYADESDSNQDGREREDIAFEAGEQTTPEITKARAAMEGGGGMPAVPERPWIVINKLQEPVRQILNQYRASEIGVEVVPAEDFGDLGVTPDETEITLREGLIRRIQRHPNATHARAWAFQRAVIAGRGYYMVMTRYLPGKTSDQEVYLHRIYEQAGVKLDPAHQAPDGADADWEFMGTWMACDRFQATHKKDVDGVDSPFLGFTDQDFVSMSESEQDWFNAADGKNCAIRIVDYYERVYTPRKLLTFADGRSEWADEFDGAVPKDATERTVMESTIQWYQIAGGKMILDHSEWPSDEMPIVKVIGEEILPFDSERRYMGIVRPARGAQMGENYMISKLVETVGMTPIPLLQLDPEAIEGYEEWYKLANTRALPYAPYRTFDDNGRRLNAPHRLPVDPNIQPLAASISMFDEFIRSTTAVPDSTLGNVDPSIKSGRAIRELVTNAQQSTSNFIDNLASYAMPYECRIINSLLYPIYGQKPGRMVRIMTGDGTFERMQIGQATPTDQAVTAQAVKVGKLTKDAHFNIIVKVSKNAQNRRMQEASALGELIAADPVLMTWFGDLYLKNGDSPDRKQLAERAKVMLAPPIQALLQAQEQGKTPPDPQTQQQMQELSDRLKHAEAAMQELEQEARGKKLEMDAKVQTEAINAKRDVDLETIKQQHAIELQRMKDATSIRVAEIAAETKGIISGHDAAHESDALHTELAHDAAMAAQAQQHQSEMAQDAMAHQQAGADNAQAFQADQAEQDRAAQTAEPQE